MISMSRKDSCPDCGKDKWKKSARCNSCNRALTGPASSKWKGGRVESNGYVRVYKPDHPRAHSGRYIGEHTLVMEAHIGRYLIEGETTHHKNGVRSDNRLENLELWVSKQPTGQRPLDLLAYADEIYQLYGHLR